METTVALKKVKFYAMHGYYEEEKKIGNQFELTLSCSFTKENDEFVNYEHLFVIANSVLMQEKSIDFLETLVEEIIEKTKVKFSFLDKIEVELLKLTPPIAKFDGKGTSVKMTWRKQ